MSHYFVIEGLIGVGKTSLCKILHQEWGARLILEPAEDNPFLASFYADRERFAFPAQMFYLATRYAQQIGLRQNELFSNVVVADYLFEKDRLFARQTLSGDTLALYERFASLLSVSIVRPHFVLFLDAPTSAILERIRKRGIRAEQQIQPDYLNALRRSYYDLWAHYDQAPVYVVETTAWDYVSNPDDRARMLAMIQGWLDGRPTPDAPAPFQALSPGQLTLFEKA